MFQDTEIFRGGFPELTDRLAGLLDDTDFLTDLNERLSALGEAYVEDKDPVSYTHLHRFIQIVGGQLLCQFHQGSIHAVCLG